MVFISERELINKFMIEYSKEGHRLWRNNVGQGWVGKTIRRGNSVIINNPRPLHAGLVKGSSDIIGLTKIKITPDMVGKEIAVFTALELKTSSTRTTKEQKSFINIVNMSGGIGAIVRKFSGIIKGRWNGKQI